MAKNSNEEKYREIIGEDKIEFIEDEPEEKNIITISQNYLMPTQHVVKFDDSTQFQREVKNFYESEISNVYLLKALMEQVKPK